MTTLHLGIASYEEMKARTLAIASGELRPQPDAPQVWLPSLEHFAKVLSNKNRALLQVNRQTRPGSITALAASTGRASGGLSRTLHRLARYGLVRLHCGPRGQVWPEVLFSTVDLTVNLRCERSPRRPRRMDLACDLGPGYK